MNLFLIDYENTKSAGLDGIERLGKNDRVWLFYSENANTLTFRMHKKINECKAEFHFQEVGVGSKNALDFQLVTYLGYLVAMYPQDHFFIVTKDKGFASAAKFWTDRGIKTDIVADLNRKNEAEEELKLRDSVREVLPDKDLTKRVVAIIQKYKTKQGINNALVREFPSQDNKKASEIYKAIKPLLKDKKGK
ncbi:MAG: hypothetical protein IIZ60_03360 [Clostridia bacterium]|nr:hypothetical protein [Clostridia bacterium]